MREQAEPGWHSDSVTPPNTGGMGGAGVASNRGLLCRVGGREGTGWAGRSTLGTTRVQDSQGPQLFPVSLCPQLSLSQSHSPADPSDGEVPTGPCVLTAVRGPPHYGEKGGPQTLGEPTLQTPAWVPSSELPVTLGHWRRSCCPRNGSHPSAQALLSPGTAPAWLLRTLNSSHPACIPT